MRKVPLEHVKEGNYNARALYTPSGQLLISSNVKMTAGYIKKLKESGYASIYIQDQYCEKEVEELIKPQLVAQLNNISHKLSKIIVDLDNSSSFTKKKRI